MSAKEGNSNAVRHGGRSNRHGMVLSVLGDKYGHVQGHVFQFRKGAESQVIDAQGKITLEQAAEINLACRYETTAQISLYLVSHGDDLPAEEIQSLLKTSVWATAERNACLRRLGLSGKATTPDPWAVLDAARLAGRDVAGPSTAGALQASDATAATSGVSDSEAIA